MTIVPTPYKFQLPGRKSDASPLRQYALFIRDRDCASACVHVIEGILADSMAEAFNAAAIQYGYLLQSYNDRFSFSLAEIARLECLCRDTFRRVYETHQSNEATRQRDEAERAEYERLRTKFEPKP